MPAIAAFLILLSAPILAEVSVTILPSGLKVIVREGHETNLVAVDIWVKAGSINETAANNGISHLTEHMIFKATRKYGPGELDRQIEGLGAELNGGTSKDWVHFYTTVASEYLPSALDVLSDALTNPQFRAEDLEKERQVILDEIARSDSDPIHLAFRSFCDTAFASHPYHLPAMGLRESLMKLTREDLVAYYSEHYSPKNMCIVIAGDVSKTDAVSQVERAFSGYQGAAKDSPVIPSEPPITSPRVKKLPSPTKQAYVMPGYLGPPASQAKEACAVDVIMMLLGDTYRGRLPAALTARGVHFDSVSTDFITQRDQSPITAIVSVEPDDVEETRLVLRDAFRQLGQGPIPDGELEHAKRLVEGADLFDQETFTGQARALGLYESIGSYEMALNYGSTVRSLTEADIISTARKYFGPDNYCLIIMEPPK
ncbi:MAG TPA: pitrilysin family protein [Armatimonadota bacterium]|nr:pitrilysin family protein [Armatimonadota bacterium]